MLTLASIVSTIGPLAAFAGGPIGVLIAWAGAQWGNTTVRTIAILVGLALLIAVSVGLTIHVQHLERDAAAGKALALSNASLEEKFACHDRPAHEQALAACLTARERDIAEARDRERRRLERAAAAAENELRNRTAELDALRGKADAAIDAAAAIDDGPVPKVMRDAWSRERAARGVK